jgi:peroxiredoxin
MPEVAHWQRHHAATVHVAVISSGGVRANRAKSEEHGITNVLLQRDGEVAAAYQAYGTPSAVLIRPDGAIGSPLVQGADAIRALVNRITLPIWAQTAAPASPQPANGANGGYLHGGPFHAPEHGAPLPIARGPAIGDLAPAFHLPDPTGEEMSLADFHGSQTLVLFWNPGCGFCQQMLPDLKRWEAERLGGSPQLVVVSTGSVETNRAMGLRSPVLLDSGFNTGSAFGASGTPSAVRVDAAGRIASLMAVGRQAILAQMEC